MLYLYKRLRSLKRAQINMVNIWLAKLSWNIAPLWQVEQYTLTTLIIWLYQALALKTIMRKATIQALAITSLETGQEEQFITNVTALYKIAKLISLMHVNSSTIKLIPMEVQLILKLYCLNSRVMLPSLITKQVFMEITLLLFHKPCQLYQSSNIMIHWRNSVISNLM